MILSVNIKQKNIKNTKYYNKLLNCEVITLQEQEFLISLIM